MSIPVFKPSVKRKELDSVLSALVEDRLGHGSVTQNLVREAGSYIGLDSGFALREYGRAIATILECLEISRGARVVISPLAPSIYMEIFLERGIDPQLADVDPDSGCISPESITKLLESKPSALFVHGTLGFMPDMEALKEFQIPLVEDVSQCLGANNGIRKSGAYGNYVIVSMEPDNIITSGGGTMVFAGGKKEAAALKRVVSLYHDTAFLQDMNAALGVVQIKRLESFIAQRKEIAGVFSRAVMQTRHRTLVQKGEAENVYYSFPVLISTGVKDVIQYARKKNIEVLPAFENSILGKFEILEQDLGHAQSILLRCVLFPLYPTLGKANTMQIEKVLVTLP